MTDRSLYDRLICSFRMYSYILKCRNHDPFSLRTRANVARSHDQKCVRVRFILFTDERKTTISSSPLPVQKPYFQHAPALGWRGLEWKNDV
jgi:hypothetical protein